MTNITLVFKSDKDAFFLQKTSPNASADRQETEHKMKEIFAIKKVRDKKDNSGQPYDWTEFTARIADWTVFATMFKEITVSDEDKENFFLILTTKDERRKAVYSLLPVTASKLVGAELLKPSLLKKPSTFPASQPTISSPISSSQTRAATSEKTAPSPAATTTKPTPALIPPVNSNSTSPSQTSTRAATSKKTAPSPAATTTKPTPALIPPANSTSIGDYFDFIIRGLLALVNMIADLFRSEQEPETESLMSTSTRELYNSIAPQSVKVEGLRGLNNEFNTCFINAVFQALMNAPGMLAMLKAGHQAQAARLQQEVDGQTWLYNVMCPQKSNLLTASTAFLAAIDAYNTNDGITLRALRGFLPAGGSYSQEDPSELLDALFAPLTENPDGQLFLQYGEQKQIRRYMEKSPEKVTQLAIEFAKKTGLSHAPVGSIIEPVLSTEHTISLALPSTPVFLQRLLSDACTLQSPAVPDDLLSFQDGWYEVAAKRQVLKPLRGVAPEWVVFQLKRFNNDGSKVNTEVGLPSDGKITLYLDGSAPADYDIQALVLHSGTTAHGGHYYSSIRKNDAWYQADDNVVSKIDDLQSQAGQKVYLIFAKKRSSPLA